MSYDVMMTLKSKEGIPFATYAIGHYMGEIQHLKKGEFSITRSVELPKILSKGIINVDLFIHHPMVEYLMMALNCCSLESEGFQKGCGRALNQEKNGFIGLCDFYDDKNG